MRKYKVFIGSSNEELEIANKIKETIDQLEHFEATIWNESLWDKSIFRFNQNYLNSLLTASLRFDFGILLGTASDILESRNEVYFSPRDNILLEFGLFLGRLGERSCAILAEHDVKLPSDLSGVHISRFDSRDLTTVDREVKTLCQGFLATAQTRVNFFPSVTLASNYYKNFLHLLCHDIHISSGLKIEDNHFEKTRIKVFIPNNWGQDINEYFDRVKKEYLTKKEQISVKGRPRNFEVQIQESSNTLIIYDVPTIITGIEYAINYIQPDLKSREPSTYSEILNRELGRFAETLNSLLKDDGFENLAIIEHENI